MSKTLYDRLGGTAGIAQLVDDAVEAHLNNPVIKTRFENAKDIEHAKKMSVEFFCVGSGGPETYSGRDMLSTHRGMNISEQEFIAVVDDIFEVMDKKKAIRAIRGQTTIHFVICPARVVDCIVKPQRNLNLRWMSRLVTKGL
jgi:hemoglobin